MYFVRLPATALIQLVREKGIRLDPYVACCFLVARELKHKDLMIGLLKNFASLDDLTGRNIAFFLFCDELDPGTLQSDIVERSGAGVAFDGIANERLAQSRLVDLVYRVSYRAYGDQYDDRIPWEKLIGVSRSELNRFRAAPQDFLSNYLTSMTVNVDSLKGTFGLGEDDIPCVLVSDTRLTKKRVYRLSHTDDVETVYDVVATIVSVIEAHEKEKKALAEREDALYHGRKCVLAEQDFIQRLPDLQRKKKQRILDAILMLQRAADSVSWQELRDLVNAVDICNSDDDTLEHAIVTLQTHADNLRELMQNARYIQKHLLTWSGHAERIRDYYPSDIEEIERELQRVRAKRSTLESKSIMDVLDASSASSVIASPDVRGAQTSTIFLSHRTTDKQWVARLAKDLMAMGHRVWLDTWEIKAGDWVATKISEGLFWSRFVVVVLSRASMSEKPSWVNAEWTSALSRELSGENVTVIPVLKDHCQIPEILRGKRYVDFTGHYNQSLSELLDAVTDK